MAALLLAAAAAGAAPRRPEPGREHFRPDTGRNPPPAQVVGRAVEATLMGLRVRVECLSDDQREHFFTYQTPLRRDPFPRREAYPAGITTFSVSMRNGSPVPVTFTPTLASCHVDRDRELRLLPQDQVFSILRDALARESDPDGAAARALDAFHVTQVELAPGATATRLLAFEGAPAKATRLTLQLEQVSVGTERLPLRFEFVADDPGRHRVKRPARLDLPPERDPELTGEDGE